MAKITSIYLKLESFKKIVQGVLMAQVFNISISAATKALRKPKVPAKFSVAALAPHIQALKKMTSRPFAVIASTQF